MSISFNEPNGSLTFFHSGGELNLEFESGDDVMTVVVAQASDLIAAIVERLTFTSLGRVSALTVEWDEDTLLFAGEGAEEIEVALTEDDADRLLLWLREGDS